MSLLVNGKVPEQKAACRLLWVLLGESSFHFNKEVYTPLLQEIITMLLEHRDKGLQLLSQILLSDPGIRANGINENLLCAFTQIDCILMVANLQRAQ